MNFGPVLLHLPSSFLAVLTGLMNRPILKGLWLFHCGVDSYLLCSLLATLPSHVHGQTVRSEVCCYPSSVSPSFSTGISLKLLGALTRPCHWT